MNPRENEPLPTSFQAGEPLPGEPLHEKPTSIDPPREVGAPSAFDELVERVKNQERWGLALGVAFQLAVLFTMIVMGSMKALGEFVR